MKTAVKESIKCRCGAANKTYCKRCSKVRMVICLKNGHENLKLNGNNPVWYSFLKFNNYQDIYKIAEAMENRVKQHPIQQATQVLLFYINGQRSHHFKKVLL
ncbi:hypothetical protein [Zunongwangia endophytica]|uniref:Transposase zinc-binding domain-containing protein n=1 Tax=Zunongwangia endophytica TaxID=1808945 RepID=A0ABV8H5N8_9FLAO|nr:hypothetical protein [Zunongwangia endophytica]MDN3595296.1 hypothetical protein [Zunongwangia endophytica]